MFAFLFSVLTTTVAAWLFVRRLQRTGARRRLDLRRVLQRLFVLAIVGVVLGLHALGDWRLAFAALAGAALGACGGWLGLMLADFEDTAQGRYYTPHRYIGLTLAAVLVARLIYQFLVHAFPSASQAAQGSPLTTALIFVVLGYHAVFLRGLVRIARGAPPPRFGLDAEIES